MHKFGHQHYKQSSPARDNGNWADCRSRRYRVSFSFLFGTMGSFRGATSRIVCNIQLVLLFQCRLNERSKQLHYKWCFIFTFNISPIFRQWGDPYFYYSRNQWINNDSFLFPILTEPKHQSITDMKGILSDTNQSSTWHKNPFSVNIPNRVSSWLAT